MDNLRPENFRNSSYVSLTPFWSFALPWHIFSPASYSPEFHKVGTNCVALFSPSETYIGDDLMDG